MKAILVCTLAVVFLPYVAFSGPFGTDDIRRHAILTESLTETGSFQGYVDEVGQTLLAPLASTPPALYVVGGSIMELAGIGPGEAANVVAPVLMFASGLCLAILARRLLKAGSILAVATVAFYFTSPGILIHVNQYVTASLALPFLFLLIAFLDGPPSTPIRTILLCLAWLVLVLSHVGTFFFALLFLPLLVWMRILVGHNLEDRLTPLIAVVLPFVVYFFVTQVLPLPQNAFQARAQISLLPRLAFLPEAMATFMADVLDRGLVEGHLAALALVAGIFLGMCFVFEAIRALLLRFLFSMVMPRLRSGGVAAAAFSLGDLIPRSLPRNLATIPFFLGPAQALGCALANIRDFRLPGLALLGAMLIFGVILTSSVVGEATINPRDFYFLVIAMALLSATAFRRFCMIPGARGLRSRARGAIGILLIGGTLAQGFLTSTLYIPSIAQEPEEALAEAYVSAYLVESSVIIAPAFGGEPDAKFADMLVRPELQNPWYQNLRRMYGGDPLATRFFIDAAAPTIYVIQTEKADRLQAYSGGIADAGMYVLYSGPELRVYYLSA